MSHARTDALIWVLVFGGLIVFGLGLSVGRSDDAIGWALCGFGMLDMAVGAVMLWSRSRSRSDPRR